MHEDHLDLSPHSVSPSSPSSSSALPVLSVANLTLFTTFSPEADRSHSEWQHAMYSWTLRLPHRNILVFTSSATHCALLQSISVDIRCRVSACWDLVHDAPYLRCVLAEARDRADTPLLLFIEDHVVLFADLVPALLKLAATMPAWVASGRSREMRLTVEKGLDLAVWQQDLEHAYLYDSSGIATVEDRENKKIGDDEDGLHDSDAAAADGGGGPALPRLPARAATAGQHRPCCADGRRPVHRPRVGEAAHLRPAAAPQPAAASGHLRLSDDGGADARRARQRHAAAERQEQRAGCQHLRPVRHHAGEAGERALRGCWASARPAC